MRGGYNKKKINKSENYNKKKTNKKVEKIDAFGPKTQPKHLKK